MSDLKHTLSDDHSITLQKTSFKKEDPINDVDESNTADAKLWTAFKNGDEAAFIQIYNQYANILFNYGCQFTADRELVKDCLQDFFIYLRKNRTGFSNTSHVKMYLLKAFKRRVVDYLKKYNRECEKNESFLFYQFPVELSSETIYINRQIEEEQIQKLNRALKALDAKEREAIYYFYYEGLSYEQIAEIFNFSHVSSARRLIYRGLSQLRKLILIFCITVMGDLMGRLH
jgi:RNA polymerase sigma factor (sigma-70 family)